MTTPKHKSQLQLLGVRAAILGSALLMGVGIFMMTSEMGPSPSQLRGDILSPEYVDLSDMAYDDLGSDTMEEDMMHEGETESMSAEERDMMVEDLLTEDSTTDTTNMDAMTTEAMPMEVMEEVSTDRDRQEVVASQDIMKAQLRGATESYWVAQDSLDMLHGAAPSIEEQFMAMQEDIDADLMAMGGPESMPDSGPELLLLAVLAVMGVVVVRRAHR